MLRFHRCERLRLLRTGAWVRGLHSHPQHRAFDRLTRLTTIERWHKVHGLLDAGVGLLECARRLGLAFSLPEAEEAVRSVCGFSEIDYERDKSTQAPRKDHAVIASDVDDKVRAYERDAAARGVDFLTFRRLAGVLDLSAAAAEELRARLIATRPDHYLPPVWTTGHGN